MGGEEEAVMTLLIPQCRGCGIGSPETCDHSYPPSDHPVKVPDPGMLGGFAVGMRKEGFPDQSTDGWGSGTAPTRMSIQEEVRSPLETWPPPSGPSNS